MQRFCCYRPTCLRLLSASHLTPRRIQYLPVQLHGRVERSRLHDATQPTSACATQPATQPAAATTQSKPTPEAESTSATAQAKPTPPTHSLPAESASTAAASVKSRPARWVLPVWAKLCAVQ
jgi:hypothetical protein